MREINAAMLKAENRLSALATDRCDKTVLEAQQYTGKAFGMIRALVKYPDTGDTAALDGVIAEMRSKATELAAANINGIPNLITDWADRLSSTPSDDTP